MQAGACLCARMQSSLYLAHRSVHPPPPLPRLIAAKRFPVINEVFRYPPYCSLQSTSLTSAVSVSGITKVVQSYSGTLGCFCHNIPSLQKRQSFYGFSVSLAPFAFLPDGTIEKK